MKAVDLLAIHPLLADRTRLAIMAALASSKDALDFSTLLETLEGVTKGNLSTHLRKLEESGLVGVTKEFVERKPRTSYVCTKAGRAEIKKYLEKIESTFRGAIKGEI